MNEEEKKAHDEAVAKATEANTNRNNDRLARIEAIADGSEENRADQMDIKDDAAESESRAKAEDEEAARLLQTEDRQDPSVAEPPVDSDTKTVNGEVYYRQIVNGHEKWQSLKQIRETAQKVESGDEYLRQASESVKNAARLALSQKDEPSRPDKVRLAGLLRRQALGEEEAIEELASFYSALPSDQTDVMQRIDQRLSFRTELAKCEDKSRDLLENPYMARLFRDRLNELKQENGSMGLTDAYSEIDQELRTAFPGMVKTSTQTKLERKRTLTNVPTAAARQATEQEPEGEEDVSDVIQQMAKARGVTPNVHSRRN